jgi:hypothetical protein
LATATAATDVSIGKIKGHQVTPLKIRGGHYAKEKKNCQGGN